MNRIAAPALLRKAEWALPESAATPEALFLSRRTLLGVGAAAMLAPALGAGRARAAIMPGEALSAPGMANPAFADPGRPITPEGLSATYNNYYEFGSHKQISGAAQALDVGGWKVAIDGMVEKPFEIDAEELINSMPLEQRVYRHRCVEAWSMVIPWTGFPLRALLDRAKPLGSAKYVQFQTFKNPSVASGQKQVWYPWPYTEGITIAEAANDLAFMVTGAYGKQLHKQFGAPLRLHLPWKYGFKSAKAITRISFVEKRPVSFWENLQASEYGFWANVNPEVSHPRWSQATEKPLGGDDRIPTLKFNGYGEQVAGLYAGMEGLGDALWR